ncbi:hypothetical protein ACIOHC_36405 [Streptomyces sp. NPDC088252]|uniref:hypothetical protein n=1 Tax=Streptomyces sp. NPDC088252 TaxID=3365845 RepID=UPI003824D9D2
MITVPAPNHFVALTYDPEFPGVAQLCLYELHEDVATETVPVKNHNGRPVLLSVNTEGRDKAELVEELVRVLPRAVETFEMLNTAQNAHLFRPEDAEGE